MSITARLESTVVRSRRISPRRRLRLRSSSRAGLKVIIHNLSATGMLVQTACDLQVSEELEVELPEIGSARAMIAWRSDDYFGCQFITAIPKVAVSAAMLRSPPLQPNSDQEPRADSDATRDDSRNLAAVLSFGTKLRIIIGTSLALWALILCVFAVI